jgi:hypothetical protein
MLYYIVLQNAAHPKPGFGLCRYPIAASTVGKNIWVGKISYRLQGSIFHLEDL